MHRGDLVEPGRRLRVNGRSMGTGVGVVLGQVRVGTDVGGCGEYVRVSEADTWMRV